MSKLIIKSNGKVILETSNPEHIANAKANLERIQKRKDEIKAKIIANRKP